jgi:hypothetical protein
MYKLMDDRPDACEGCKLPDSPSQFGPSVRQISWHFVLQLWLCCDCRYQWIEWDTRHHDSESIRETRKPSFLKALDRERSEQV